MRKLVFRLLLLGSVLVFSDGLLTSCASSKHCPAVAGTGNYKPKVRRKPQDGLMSKKMEKQMAKGNKPGKGGPIAKKKLSVDQ